MTKAEIVNTIRAARDLVKANEYAGAKNLLTRIIAELDSRAQKKDEDTKPYHIRVLACEETDDRFNVYMGGLPRGTWLDREGADERVQELYATYPLAVLVESAPEF